jgi:predicted RNA-binding Zn-ribbon protein involved in translation (DUF1610 family)
MIYGTVNAMDILFNCQACGQGIVIDEAGVGLFIQCPKCNRSLIVPVPKSVEQSLDAKLTIDSGNIKKMTVAIQWTPPPTNIDGQPEEPHA